MFGAAGLSSRDVFFAIVMDDVLYLKVDDATRARYTRVRARAFRPYRNRPSSKNYYAVPLAVLESAADLTVWARESIAAAARAKKTRKKSTRKAAR
jgi:DNA transformation protein